jgi:hypothetical protein
MEKTPAQEAEELVGGVVDDERSRIAEEHEELIETITENLSNFREMNVVFSETRRRLEDE